MSNVNEANVRKETSTESRDDTRGRLQVLQDRTLGSVPWLVHGFSTRQGGRSTCYGGRTLNLGRTQHDNAKSVEENRVLFLSSVGAVDDRGRPWPLMQVKQIHSAVVQRVDGASREAATGDGLITNTPGLLLAIKTADCVPVLVADVRRKLVGAFHAGWRGTAARVVEKGIGEMRRHFGSVPRDLRAAIGPCIRKCCYVVGPEVQAEFESQFSYAGELFQEEFNYNALSVRYPMLFLNQRAPGHGEAASETHLDLVEANRRQLEDAGLRSEHIGVIEGCTACDTTRFFSHRAENGKTGRMMAVIGIKPE
jgi:YfiH family protein